MLRTEAGRPIEMLAKSNFRTYDFASDDSGMRLDAVADRLKNLREVGDLMATFRHWSTKFKFGTTSRDIWERKYRFSRSESTFESDSVVNSGPSSVRAYVDQVIALAKDPRPPVLMLVGDVGSGKSSFNKYVTTCYHDEFKQAGIIASRVEFQKLHQHLKAYPDLPPAKAANAFIFATLLRDVALYAFGQEAFGKGDPFDLSLECRLDRDPSLVNDRGQLHVYSLITRILEMAEGPHYHDRGVTEALVERFFKQFSRYPAMQPAERSGFVAFWAKYLLTDHADSRPMAAIAEIFVSLVLRQYRAFLIFDGFDYIGVNDFLDDSLLGWTLDWLSDSLISTDGFRLPISRDRLHSFPQITIRKSTNEIFWRKRMASHTQVNCAIYLVETPSVEAVIDGLDRLIAHFAPTSSEVGAIWSEMLNRSVQHLYDWLRQPDSGQRCSFTPADLFQNNSRHLVNFLRDVIEIELDLAYRKLFKRGGGINARTLANEMREHFEDLVAHRRYALVQILLSSRSTRYQNFLSVKSEQDGCVILEDNDNGSGYIGNPFNYHAAYDPQQGLREFTHKLLILKQLCQTRRATTLEEISDFIGFDLPFTKLSMQLMIRENMVEAVYNVQRRTALFRASKLGQIVFDHLIDELSYLESVFFGMSIPAAFIDPELQDVHRSDGATAWVNGSLANVTLVLRMMRTAGESAIALTGADELADVHERMTKSLDEAFQRIARSSSGLPMLTSAEVERVFDRQKRRLG